MGTRSTIKFIERNDSNDTVIASIYQQFDGYPDGVGAHLFEFLNSFTIVNGLGMDNNQNTANGPGCLAAQFIAKSKVAPGGFYMTGPNDNQEYNYSVYFEWVNGIQAISKITCAPEFDTNSDFSGTLEDFGEFCAGDDDDNEHELALS